MLPWVKGKSFPLTSELLQGGTLNALTADVPGRDRLLGQLGGRLVGNGSAQLWWDGSTESLQGTPIILILHVTVADHLLESLC
jgi:hypothetical protein